VSDAKECDYEVGFGKPPKHTQFHKGRSGNPRVARVDHEMRRRSWMKRLASESSSPRMAGAEK
jgi:hypothetical protein